jgi:hypothetical protein|tara:strand:+ start:3318 stop:3614 length:297 start_codon:yes stop_codon:yes gene_type:complete
MKFKEIKKQALDCLKKGQVEHEQRDDINVKNLLAVGQVSLDDVANIIGRSSGNEYSHSPHHVVSGIEVNIIKTKRLGKEWYVKWYFIEPNTIFISVHN